MNETSRGLFAAATEAEFAGDPSAAKSTGSLLGRHTLMESVARKDYPSTVDALDTLRRVGDNKGVDLASRRLYVEGPLDPLKSVAESLGGLTWTTSAISSNFAKNLVDVSDLLGDDGVELAARFALEGLTDVNHPLYGHLQASYSLRANAIKTLRVLLGRPLPSVHRLAADLLVQLTDGHEPSALELHELERLVSRIRWEDVDATVRLKVTDLTAAGTPLRAVALPACHPRCPSQTPACIRSVRGQSSS